MRHVKYILNMINKIFKKILQVVGLEINRIDNGIRIVKKSNLAHQAVTSSSEPFGGRIISRVPPPNFENIALVMEYFTVARPNSIFVQIGANDGETSDSVNTFVKRGTMRSVLVEPVVQNFEKLARFYNGVPNVKIVRAAISFEIGESLIYSVRDEGRWEGSAWAAQIASFDREHLLRHGILPDEIESSKVECFDLITLMDRTGISRIDVLQIDVEGYDAEVVKMALLLPIPPLCICFENIQFLKKMNQKMVNEFYDLLRLAGYSWSHDRINSMAVHESFLRSGQPAQRSVD
jgi:FkbM family methyltransferase